MALSILNWETGLQSLKMFKFSTLEIIRAVSIKRMGKRYCRKYINKHSYAVHIQKNLFLQAVIKQFIYNHHPFE